MYNENLKTQFIREHTNSLSRAKLCTVIFNQTEKLEKQWGKDIYIQDDDTAINAIIQEVSGVRSRTGYVRTAIIKEYIKWCIANQLPGACDKLLHINTFEADTLKDHLVSNPAHLEKYLNEVFKPTEHQTIENIYRCYYWLAYSGLEEENIFNITNENIDLSRMVIKHYQNEYPIYREGVMAIKSCMDLTEFRYSHPNYRSDVWRERTPGDILIRGIKSEKSIKAMRTSLSRMSKKAGSKLKLSYYRVWLSGTFYRMYEKEQMGIQPDFTGIALKRMKNDNKFDSMKGHQESYYYHRVIADYQRDYRRWKDVYK